MGANGTIVKERILLGLRAHAKLVECLWAQKVFLSRNEFHLAFEFLLIWVPWCPCQGTDFTGPLNVC